MRSRELFSVSQQTVKTGNSDVVHARHTIAHDLRRDDSFFRHGNVTGTRRDDQNRTYARDCLVPLDADRSGPGVKPCVRSHPAHRVVDSSISAGDQDVVLRFRPHQLAHDSDDLLGSFSGGVNDFGEALAQCAVMIHLREAKVLERQVPKLLDS
jgi:hypothetical protein